MIELEMLRDELKALPREKQLAIAHWLLDSLADMDAAAKHEPVEDNGTAEHPLLRWAGIFSGGPGDTAERDEEILEAEIDEISGWSPS
jgi:hypothetical protein